MHRPALFTASVLAVASIAGCGDAGSPSADPQVSFNVATRPAASPAASAAALSVSATPETFTDGTNVLVIDQVQLVLREIELKRAESATPCAGTSNDGCEELELGPIVLDLPLGGAGGAARAFTVAVAAGTYDEVEFKIHPPANGASVTVTGTFNGEPFTFTSGLEAEEEIELSPPLVVAESSATDLTLFVDLDRWFRDDAGGLVNPDEANAGGPKQSLVENNIRSTLHAFEDEDRDGTDDHGGDDASAS